MLNIVEKKRELANRIKDLHLQFEGEHEHWYTEKNRLWNKNEEALIKAGEAAKANNSYPLNPDDFMSAEDAVAYKKIKEEESFWEHECHVVIQEILSLLYQENDIKNWERKPFVGTPGVLADTNSRGYQSKLDDNYSFQISWWNYPLDDGQVLESFRESYGASIQGSMEFERRKGFYGVGRKTKISKFPLNGLEVAQNDNREFKAGHFLQKEFDEVTVVEFQKQLLDLGKRLQEQFG